jgi:anti-sigma B factor antagonist
VEELIDPGGSRARLEEVFDATGEPVLKVSGELDLSNVGSIRTAIEATVGRAVDRIVFDLSELRFMDSSGLAMLLAVAERVRTLELRRPPETVRRVIELTGLASAFVISD